MRIFDSGRFRVTLPDGWMAFCGTDSSGKITPKKVHIYKGITLKTDIITHAGITVCFFGKKDYYLSPKHFYDNIADMAPSPSVLTLGTAIPVQVLDTLIRCWTQNRTDASFRL